MPCKKCKDGKYKWGNTGECKYATKEECDKANPNKYNKMKEYPTPLGKKTYDEYAKELKEFNLSTQRVELGEIDDLKRNISNAEQKLKTASKFHKSAEKLNTQLNKLIAKKADIEAQANKVNKERKDFVKSGRSLNSEIKTNINKARKSAKAIEKQLKDLGLDSGAVNKENTQIEKLADSLNKLNYAFLDELPF